MRDLNYQLKQLCRRNKDGSFSTQRDRERLLTQIADQLHALGYRHMGAQSLKPKHVESLVKHWQQEGLSAGALKNRMAAIRWWAQKVNRQNVVARSNDYYGIPNRQFVSQESKANTVQVCDDLEAAIASGAAREKLDDWVAAQGGDPGVLDELGRRRAPVVAGIGA